MKIKLLLLAICVLALFLRMYHFGENPPSLYWDEAAIGYDAYALVQTGHDMHGNSWWQPIFPSYGDYKMPVYIWLSSLALRIVGVGEWGVRLPSMVFGLVGVALSYLIARELFERKVFGLAAALATAIMPGDILFSRVGFEGHVGMVFVMLTVWLWLLAQKRPYLWLVSGLTGALGVYTYFSVRVMIPLVFAGFLGLYWKHIAKFWSCVGVATFLLLLLPLTHSPYYAASNQFRLSTVSLLNTDDHILLSNAMVAGNNGVWWSRFIYHRYVLFLWRFLQQAAAFFDLRYLFFTGDPNLRHGTGQVGLLLPVMLPFVVLGIWRLITKHMRTLLFYLWWWVVAVVPAAIPLTVPHALRSINALPVAAMLSGVGLGAWIAYCLGQKRRLWLTLTALAVLLSGGVFFHDYLTHYPIRSAEDWQYGYKQLAVFAGQQRSTYPTIYITAGDRLYLYFLFFNRIDPRTLVGSFKDFQLAAFDQFIFGPVNTPVVTALAPNTLVLASAAEVEKLTIPVTILDTINTYSGEPAYYALKVE